MEKDNNKNIDKEILEIYSFFKNEIFIVENENFPTNDGELITSKKNEKTHIDFKLKLNQPVHPNDLTFKKLGFSDNFKISSKNKTYIIPSNGITKIEGKSFIHSGELKGEISSIYSEKFPLKEKSFFRLVLKISEEHSTTKFLGSKYSCGESHYSIGLISINITQIECHIYRYSENAVNYLVIENLSETLFEEFQNICESTLKSIGFLTGNWFQDEFYFFSYNSNEFKKIESLYYHYFGNSIVSHFEIINPQQLQTFIETDNEKSLLTSLLFPEKILSNIITFSMSKPEFERTIELINEGNQVTSPLIRCSVFSVALETIVSLIHSENKFFFKPLKQPEKFNKLLKDLQSIIDEAKMNLNNSEYNFLSKKVTYINTPFNKDKYLLAFDFFKIDLPKKLHKVLDTRNKFFHGKTPYAEGELKTKIKELHLEADRLHLLVSILILKYSGYKGHIKNQAGYRLELEKLYGEKDDIKIDESAFYRI